MLRRSKQFITNQRVGIYSGTFDPVHSGHIGFALQAIKAAQLDIIYFVPERRPRNKAGITHYGHRVGMLKRALKPYPNLTVLDLPDISFTIQTTLPRLTKIFKDAELSLIMGSDVAEHLSSWPGVEQLLKRCELVIGLRSTQNKLEILEKIEQLPLYPPMVTLLDSKSPHLSSGLIRHALRHNQPTQGLLSSVLRYARSRWLYVSLSE